MPPLVVDVMQAHKAALLRRDQQQMAVMAVRWRELETQLQDQVELFARRVAEDRLNPGQIRSRQFQLDRYRSLLEQVRTELERYVDYAEPLIAAEQRTLGQAAINQAGQAIRAVASGTRIAFDVLPIRAIENMVGLAGNGSPLRTLLVDSFGAGSDGMLNQLIRATTIGQNPRETARAMVRQGLSQSLNRMMTIARTEQLRVYRESSRMAYQASGVVSGYRRLATKDSRTCPACLMLDGELYELTETLREHPQGRCTLLPIVDGFRPVEWEKGQDWFKNQSPATQRSILGAGRYDLWRNGGLDLDQFATVRRNPVWGDSVAVTSVGEARSLARPVTVREPDRVRLADIAIARDDAAVRLVRLAQQSQEAVHRLPSGLTPVNVQTASVIEQNPSASGVYSIEAFGQAPSDRGIVIRNGPRAEFVYHHEFGHYLDHQYLLISSDMRFIRPRADKPVDEALRQAFWDIIKRTSSFRQLDDRRAELRRVQEPNSDPSGELLMLNYLTQESEVWARAYSQYVAVRSGGMRDSYSRSSWQWSDDEFEPVANAIDRILENVGLR